MTTLASLRTQFFQRYDAAQNGYIQTVEANALLNEAARHLHNWFLVEGEFYLWKEAYIPLVAGQGDYTLPADFMKILKVFMQPTGLAIGQAILTPLHRVMPEEYRGQATSGILANYSGNFQPHGYMMLGQTLRIMPVPPPTNQGKILLWYAPIYQDMALDTDTTEACIFPGCEEFIVNRAVISARIKEEGDSAPLERKQAETMQLIQQAMINRDMGKHSRVVDASDNRRYF